MYSLACNFFFTPYFFRVMTDIYHSSIQKIETLVQHVCRATTPDLIFDYHSQGFVLQPHQKFSWQVTPDLNETSDYTMAGYVYTQEEEKTYISCGGLLVCMRKPCSITLDMPCYIHFWK